MRSLLVVLGALAACQSRDVTDPPLPGPDGEGPVVGSEVLRFRGAIPKNLIFLSIDTLRKDHLGAHGSLGLTPFLDEIAEQGVVLDDHMQCSNWTYASTTCTLAGRTNIERGHLPRLSGGPEVRTKVPEGTRFLASWLREKRFYSVLIAANDWLSPNWGNAQGYVDFQKPGGNAYQVHKRGIENVREAVANGAERWFMHLHFMEPHAAYDPPEANVVGVEELEPWPEDLTERETHYSTRDTWPDMPKEQQDLLEMHLRRLYEGEVRTIDERLEDIWRDLEREGYLNDTLVVVWTDHGEQFWEHGAQTHAYTLHGEENDGFAMFWSRNILPGRYEGPTSAIDLVPTLLDLYGIDRPEEVTGYPVGEAPAGRVRYAEALARRGAINVAELDGLKMHFSWRGRVWLFDRNEDPGETVDLYNPSDPRTLEMWRHVRPQAEAMAELILTGAPRPTFPEALP